MQMMPTFCSSTEYNAASRLSYMGLVELPYVAIVCIRIHETIIVLELSQCPNVRQVEDTHRKPVLKMQTRKNFRLRLSLSFRSDGIGTVNIARSIAMFVPAAA